MFLKPRPRPTETIPLAFGLVGRSPALLPAPHSSATWKVNKHAWEEDETRERFRATADSQQQMGGNSSLAGKGKTDFISAFLSCEEGRTRFFIGLYAFSSLLPQR